MIPDRSVDRLFTFGLILYVALFRAAVANDESETQIPDVAVGVGKIERATVRAYVTAYGIVEAEPARNGKAPASASVAAQTAGLITEARCEEGQSVQRGQVLFSLDHRLADIQIGKARAAVTLAEHNLRRKLSLTRTGNVSRKLLEEARQQLESARQDLALARTQRALLQVEAPLEGTLVHIHVRPGEAVGTNSILAEIVDLDRLVANVAVPAAEIPRVRIDQPATLSVSSDHQQRTLNGLPDIQGTVSFVGLQVDPRTVTVPVRIALPKESGLRPGQFVRVRIAVEEHADRLAVPVESVVTLDGQSTIFVVENDLAVRKPVRIGIQDGDFVEIEGANLTEGMKIVTTGAWGLPDQVRIHRREP